jgi:glutamate synthase (ferredoxin)
VGVATQDEVLRAKFTGAADHVVHFMRFVAQQLREIMAKLGYRTIPEMVGHTDRLEMRKAIEHWKAQGLDYSKVLYRPKVGPEVGTSCIMSQDHLLERALDNTHILELCKPAIERGEKVYAELPIVNVNRVVGTITGAEISRRHGAAGLPDGTIHLKFLGTAGQSLGAFCPQGMTLELEGDANDYVGKGLCGARIIIYPPKNSVPGFEPDQNMIIGNVAFYGATRGEAFLSGMAGERFCVRNSGVHAVIEGVGDHGCEYMTGGSVICLGSTGRNFAAGMSGGVAYILDQEADFATKLNTEMVRLLPLRECGDAEISDVKSRIETHLRLTGSPKAARLLADWENTLDKFLKVLPTDYERVLLAIKQAEEQGLEGDDAIQAAFEANAKVGH